MKRIFSLALGLLLFSVLFSACSVASRNALVGKWNNQEQAITLEFTTDGRFRQVGEGVTQEMYFQFLDDHSFEIKSPGAPSGTQPIAFNIAGDMLTLDLGADPTSGQAQTLKFQRVK